jgi:hypothetical protein
MSQSIVLTRNDFWSDNPYPFDSVSNHRKLQEFGLNYEEEYMKRILKNVSLSTNQSHWRHLIIRIIFFLPVFCFFIWFYSLIKKEQKFYYYGSIWSIGGLLVMFLFIFRAFYVNINGLILMKKRTQSLLNIENSKNNKNFNFRITLWLNLKISKNSNNFTLFNEQDPQISEAILTINNPSNNLEIVSIFHLPNKAFFNLCREYEYKSEKINSSSSETQKCIKSLNIIVQNVRGELASNIKKIPSSFFSILILCSLILSNYYSGYFKFNQVLENLLLVIFALCFLMIILSSIYAWSQEEKILYSCINLENKKLLRTGYFVDIRNECESVAVIELNKPCSMEEFVNEGFLFEKILE